jgi:DNA invertase Pin-like site-specific DNA recombinase
MSQPSTLVEVGDIVMAQGAFIAYYRVSTIKQGASGLGLEAQRKAVMDYLNGGNWTLLAEFTEVESGKKDDRPQLAAAMEQCRLTGAMLVVAKLDRLSRDVAFLANLMKGKVPFVACDNPHATPFTIHILAAVAQHEREAISARTRAALAASKALRAKEGLMPLGGNRGVPAPNSALGVAARNAKAVAFAARVAPTLAALQQRGLSLNQMAAELTAKGIMTAQGGTWTATAVRRALERATIKPHQGARV